MRSATDAERRRYKIPPSFVDAKVSLDPKSEVRATAVSPTTGKRHAYYSAAYTARQAKAKWGRIAGLHRVLRRVVSRVGRDSRRGMTEAYQKAMTLRIILQTGMRNGDENESGTYGASSLLLRHVTVDGSQVHLAFPGKGNVAQRMTIDDAVLARYVRNRKGRAGRTKDSPLFDHTADDTLAYFKDIAGSAYKVHDIRTWYATVYADQLTTRLLKTSSLRPKTKKERAAFQRRVASKVAERLGNTPPVTLKTYIHPYVWNPLKGKAREALFREFNKNHEPAGAPDKNGDGKGDGGQFAHADDFVGPQGPLRPKPMTPVRSSKKPKKAKPARNARPLGLEPPTGAYAGGLVTEGVDFDQNLSRWLTAMVTSPEDRAAKQADLDELPLVHGTTVMGAVAASRGGLQSWADLADERAAARDEIRELQEDVAARMGLSPHDVASWAYPHIDVETVRSAFPQLSLSEAEEVTGLLMDLSDLDQMLSGNTFNADQALGLDRMVFMTHGMKHQDYGSVGVIIDNAVLQQEDTWATPHDIVVYNRNVVDATPVGPYHSNAKYAPEAVQNYRSEMFRGADYTKAAAADVRQPDGDDAMAKRGRDHLWEVKAPSVPAGAIKGYLVTSSLEDAQRLRDRLGRSGQGRVLYVDQMAGTKGMPRWLSDQMKFVQSQGYWDPAAVDAMDEQTGNSGTVMLF